MTWKSLAAAAAGMLILCAAFDPAEARRGGGGGRGGGKISGGHHVGGGRSISSNPRHMSHHHGRPVRHRRGFASTHPVYAADSCAWLRRRALRTGNPYWWDRYDACLYGYY